MKLFATETAEKRPFSATILVNFLAALALLLIVGAHLFVWQSPIGQAVWVVGKVFFHLVSPIVWLGGFLVAAFWLALLTSLWRKATP